MSNDENSTTIRLQLDAVSDVLNAHVAALQEITQRRVNLPGGLRNIMAEIEGHKEAMGQECRRLIALYERLIALGAASDGDKALYRQLLERFPADAG